MSLGLVAIDMDATLLRNDKSYDRERFDKIVREFHKRGTKVCIASGNVLEKLEQYISKPAQELVYLAGDNGNVIAQNQTVFEEKSFSPEVISQLQKLDIYEDHYEVIVSTGFNVYATGIKEEVKDYVKIYYENITYVDSLQELPNGEKPVKIAMLTPHDLEENKVIKEAITDQIPGISAVTSGGGWVDMYHKDGGKGYAMEYLQEKYGISKEETMAFGDSLNDEPMMEHAKYSVCMENGDEDLRAVCKYGIGTNEDQAVLDVLETFLKTDSVKFMEDYAVVESNSFSGKYEYS